MRKFYLLFALLISFSSAAWADFHQPWTSTPFPWSSTAVDEANIPSGISTGATNYTVHVGTVSVIKEGETGDATVHFAYSGGNSALRVLGVDLINSEGTVVKEQFNDQMYGSNNNAFTYTLSGVEVGTYTLRYWICNTSGENIRSTNGLITVTGLNSAYITSLQDLSNDKVYALKSNKANDAYVYYSDGVENVVATIKSPYNNIAYNANDNKFHFAIYNDGSSYFLYNIAAGKFVGTTTSGDGAIPWTAIPTNDIKIKYTANSAYAFIMSCNNGSGAINLNSNVGNFGVLNWNGGYNGHLDDAGNQFQFIEVGDLSAETKALIAERTPWKSAYVNTTYAVNNPSDVYVNAIPNASLQTVSDAKSAFESNPSTATYEAMVSAYESNKIKLAAGEIFKIKCIESVRGYLAYSTVEEKGSETNAWLAQTNNANHPSLTDQGAYTDFALIEILGKKYIYNTQNKQILKKGTPVTFAELGSYVELIEESATQFNIKFDGERKYLSFSQGWGAQNPVRTEGFIDNGCRFFLVKQGANVADDVVNEVAERFRPQCLSELNTKLAKARLLGTGVSKYTYNGSGDAAATIATAEDLLTSETATTMQLNASFTALDAIYADFSLNMPEVGKLYRFKGYASKNYIAPTAATPTADTKMAMNSNMDLPGTVFMLCAGSEISGNTGYKLLNYFTGYYTKNTHNLGAMASAANSMTIKEATSGNPGCYMLKTNYTGSQWVFDNNTVVDRNGAYQAGNCDWTMEEVTWLPIPVNNTYGIGTLYSPVDIAISDAYYAKDSRLKFYIGSIEDDYLVLTKLEDNIPAETPVVIEYQEHSGYKNGCAYMAIAANAEAVTAKNDLRGTLETIDTPEGTIYTLQRATQDATELTFCLYTGTTLKGGKAYLPAASAVKGIRYNTGESTGIEAIATEKGTKEIFDLSGRRVQNPTSGLYIINGQKVYVK